MGKEDIAAKLKQARISANKTQKEVADTLGMTYQAISNYERGKTKVESDILVKLCQIYGISIREVLSNQPITTKKNLAPPVESDKRLQQIIHYYNGMDEIGKENLVEQAEYLFGKHKTQENEKMA